MEPLETTNDENSEIDTEETPSVDEFIKQLEEREKDLHIPSDLVIEVGDSEVEHENIHDSFIAMPDFISPKAHSVADQMEKPRPQESSEDKVEFEAKLKKISDERDEYRDSLKRQKRDFDNYRLRTERERQGMFQNILGSLAGQMLPVLDNLNRALDANSEAEKLTESHELHVFFEGVVLVNQQLNEVFAGMGVQPIPAVGELFDPNIHEAVASVETDEFPPKTVIQELLRGYRIDERVIRASMVKVSASPAKQPEKDSQSPDAE